MCAIYPKRAVPPDRELPELLVSAGLSPRASRHSSSSWIRPSLAKLLSPSPFFAKLV